MKFRRPLLVILLIASVLSLTASGAASQEDAAGADEAGSPATAHAQLTGADGRSMGSVTLIEGPNGVLVQAHVTGLTPGGHGFHIHGVGACEPDFGAAGGHFNPGDIPHGFMNEGGWHPGDLPNIYAGADGTARADIFTTAVTLAADAENSLFDDDGSAIIVHAAPDSYGEAPGAGDRVACGVIRHGSAAADDEMAGDEMAGGEMAGDEMSGEEMASGDSGDGGSEEMAGEATDSPDAATGPAPDSPTG